MNTKVLTCLLVALVINERVKAVPTTINPQVTFVESNDTAVEALRSPFDCRRTGHDCDETGGTCDLETGSCTCNENYTGYGCNFPDDSILSATMCNNGTGCGEDPEAVCLNSEAPACFCPYAFFGESCEKPRIELRCSSEFLTIHANPYNSDSTVYVIDREEQTKVDNPACAFQGNETHTLQITYTDAVAKCGAVALDNSTTEMRFVVQADEDWLTSFDQIVTARCSLIVGQEFQKTIIVEAGIAAAGAQVVPQPQGSGARVSNDLSNLGEHEIAAERQKIEFVTITPHPTISLGQEEVENDVTNIVPINGSVKVGDVVIFTVENVDEPVFAAIRAEECTLKMDESMSMNLIKNQCPATRLAWTLLEWKKTKATNSTVSYYLRLPANALAGHPRQITITCHVKLCAEDVVDECALPDDECKSAREQLLAPRQSNTRSRRNTDSTAYAVIKKTFDLDYEERPKSHFGSVGSSAGSVQLSIGVVGLVMVKWFF